MKKEMINEFQSIRQVNMLRIKEGKENGLKVVGIYCTYCPQELILAAGAVPVGLCGTSEKPIANAEEVLPRNLCPLIKSSYGFAATDTCPFFHFSDLVIGETTCDGKKKMFEIMNEIKPVHVMQLPYIMDSEASLVLWAEEIRRLRSRLEEVLQVEIMDDKIWEAIRLVNLETAASKAVSDLNQMDPPPLTGMDLLTVTWSRSFVVDKKEVISMLNKLITSVHAEKPEGASGRPRILLTGCPVGIGTEKVIQIVEGLGAYVVAMENCSGYKTLPLQADEEESDPIVALARKYLEIPCSCMSPNRYRMELLDRMLDDFRVDGVIDLTWQACHTYNIEAFEVGRLVKKRNLPYLHLESDYSNADIESLKVRIEAMLEMVEK